MNGRFWFAEDLQIVRWLYPHVKTEKIAGILGRKTESVYQIANQMGLRKTQEFLRSPESGILLKGQTRPGSVATQFRKGIVPHNKGLRRPGWFAGRMRETMFKKGQRTGAAARNWVPIGTIKADGEGFLRIKVREGLAGEASGFGNTRTWPLLNRHNWEKEFGPIPPSHSICFKDGDRGNCDPSNLECVSRADLARRNVMWNRYPRAVAEVIQLNGALKRKLRRLARGEHEEQAAGPAQPPVRDAGGVEGRREADGPGPRAGGLGCGADDHQLGEARTGLPRSGQRGRRKRLLRDAGGDRRAA